MVRLSTPFLLRDPMNHQYHRNFRGNIVVGNIVVGIIVVGIIVVGIDQYGDRVVFERNFMALEQVFVEIHELFAFWNIPGLCSIDQLEFRWASV
jgi:hypothetical protein